MFFNSEDFKKKWSEIELRGVKSILQEFFKEYHEIENFSDYFAIGYSSSSEYAMLNCQNKEFAIHGAQISHFALTQDNKIVAVAFDSNDNYRFFNVNY